MEVVIVVAVLLGDEAAQVRGVAGGRTASGRAVRTTVRRTAAAVRTATAVRTVRTVSSPSPASGRLGRPCEGSLVAVRPRRVQVPPVVVLVPVREPHDVAHVQVEPKVAVQAAVPVVVRASRAAAAAAAGERPARSEDRQVSAPPVSSLRQRDDEHRHERHEHDDDGRD